MLLHVAHDNVAALFYFFGMTMVRELMARATTLGRVGLPVWIFSSACIAQAQQDAAAVQPPPPADATAMVAFLFIFLGMIGAYVAWIFYQQKKRKKTEIGQPDKA